MDFRTIIDGLDEVAKVLSHVMSVLAFIALIVKPVRERLFGLKDVREANKCQLRSDMLRTYYRHREEDKIRQYEKENFLYSGDKAAFYCTNGENEVAKARTIKVYVVFFLIKRQKR